MKTTTTTKTCTKIELTGTEQGALDKVYAIIEGIGTEMKIAYANGISVEGPVALSKISGENLVEVYHIIGELKNALYISVEGDEFTNET